MRVVLFDTEIEMFSHWVVFLDQTIAEYHVVKELQNIMLCNNVAFGSCASGCSTSTPDFPMSASVVATSFLGPLPWTRKVSYPSSEFLLSFQRSWGCNIAFMNAEQTEYALSLNDLTEDPEIKWCDFLASYGVAVVSSACWHGKDLAMTTRLAAV